MADGVTLAAIIFGAKDGTGIGAQEGDAVISPHEVVFEADDEAVIHGEGTPAALGHGTPFLAALWGHIGEFAIHDTALVELAFFVHAAPARLTARDIEEHGFSTVEARGPRHGGVVGVWFERGERQDRFDFIQQHILRSVVLWKGSRTPHVRCSRSCGCLMASSHRPGASGGSGQSSACRG